MRTDGAVCAVGRRRGVCFLLAPSVRSNCIWGGGRTQEVGHQRTHSPYSSNVRIYRQTILSSLFTLHLALPLGEACRCLRPILFGPCFCGQSNVFINSSLRLFLSSFISFFFSLSLFLSFPCSTIHCQTFLLPNHTSLQLRLRIKAGGTSQNLRL